MQDVYHQTAKSGLYRNLKSFQYSIEKTVAGYLAITILKILKMNFEF